MRYSVGAPPFQWLGEINRESEQLRGLVRWYPTMQRKGIAIVEKINNRVNQFPTSANRPSYVLQHQTENVGRTLYFVASSFTDANRDYVSIDSVSLGTEQTFSYWIAYDNYSAQAYGGVALGYNNDYYFDWISGTTRYAAFGSGNVAFVTSGITKGAMQHLAISRSGTSVWFYLNGKPDSTVQTLGSDNAVTISLIGAATTVANGYYGLNGTLTDIRIYNRSLSAAEIWQLYDPQTRWQLYATPEYRRWFVPVVAGGIIPRIRHHMAQQGMA